jgi:hypothetical protein
MGPHRNISNLLPRLIVLVALASSSQYIKHHASAFSVRRHFAPLKPCAQHHHTSSLDVQYSYQEDGDNNVENSQLSQYMERRRFLHSLFTSTSAIALSSTSVPLPSNAATRDPKTGILLPSVGEIESSIPSTWDEDDNPFASTSTSSFSRLDSTSDTIFYTEPRFVEHVDEQAVESMTSYISNVLIHPGDSVLDLCSSWTSHIKDPSSLNLKRVSGLGMNAKELEANSALTDWTILDLNADKNARLPYENASFDVAMCQLSIDYLIHPLEVMKEASRVLKVRCDGMMTGVCNRLGMLTFTQLISSLISNTQ